MSRTRELDPEVAALVRDKLEGDEIVHSWSELRPGEVSVHLISEELHRVCESIAKGVGRGAGCGRTLEFKHESGKWVFQGVGGWVS